MIGDYMLVNGEQIPIDEVKKLLSMFYNDCKQIAGHFYEMERSPKFRANWPIDTVYVNCNWRNFFQETREFYASLLGNDHVSPYDKHRIFLAIALHDQVEKCSPKFEGVQMFRGTQQFEGDRYENRRITESYGRHSNTFKELLMGGTRYH